MELPRGLQKTLPKVKEEIKCPVVENFKNRSRGRYRSVDHPEPDPLIKIQYDPKLTLQDLEDFWIASSIKHHRGNLSVACRALGLGKATIYKKIQKMFR